jgi:hypothetical protein
MWCNVCINTFIGSYGEKNICVRVSTVFSCPFLFGFFHCRDYVEDPVENRWIIVAKYDTEKKSFWSLNRGK